ncbi:MAG: hypothetical protein ABH890_01265 [Bacillota bacterium]
MKIKNLNLYVKNLENTNDEVVVFLNGVMVSTNSWYAIIKLGLNTDIASSYMISRNN